MNKSISEYVAATMDAVIRSQEHQRLHNTQYKFASDMNDAKDKVCPECKHKECVCPDKSKAMDKSDSACADDNDHYDTTGSEYSEMNADDGADENDASDTSDTSEQKNSTAFAVAIDSLLTASAALDHIGMEKSASLSLKLASFVAEAKKKEEASKKKKDSKKPDSKDKAKGKSDKGKSDKDKDKGKSDKGKSAKSPASKSTNSVKKK